MSKYDFEGNLARQYKSYSPHYLPTPQEIPERRFAEEEAKRIKRRRELQREAEIKKRYRALSRERIRFCIGVIAAVALMTLMVSVVVTRYARITEMSFLNAGMKQRIENVEMSNNALHNKLSEQFNFEAIKDTAQNDLGLQLAGSNQILYISGKKIDKTQINTKNLNSTTESSWFAGKFYSFQENAETIEGYVVSQRP